MTLLCQQNCLNFNCDNKLTLASMNKMKSVVGEIVEQVKGERAGGRLKSTCNENKFRVQPGTELCSYKI